MDVISRIRHTLGMNNNNNIFDSSDVVANKDGSVLERLELLQRTLVSKDSSNYLAIPIVFAAATTGSVASHEILTVTGMVRLRIIAECVTNLAGTGSIQLGVEGVTDGFIAVTAGTDIDAGEIWVDATPTEIQGNTSTLMLDKIVAGGLDVGYEVTVGTLTSGAITFHVWWDALNATGAVVAANGTAAL